MTGIVLGPKHLTDSGKLSRPIFPSGIETTSIWLHQGNYDEQIEVEHVAGRRIKPFLKAMEILELLWQHNLAYVIHRLHLSSYITTSSYIFYVFPSYAKSYCLSKNTESILCSLIHLSFTLYSIII